MRKLRTRQHIIEDLGFNHVERQVLLAGYVVERHYQHDYGYDGTINTFNEKGEAENGNVLFQTIFSILLRKIFLSLICQNEIWNYGLQTYIQFFSFCMMLKAMRLTM